MAEESNQANPQTRKGIEKFGKAAVAFDDMIVQVGRGISRAQELMDRSQIEFHKKAAREIKDGKMKQLDLNPSNAYSIPETKVNIRLAMSLSYPEEGGEPTLSAIPLNANSTNESDINVEAATEIKLKFVSVPPNAEPPGTEPSAMSQEQVLALSVEDSRVKAFIAVNAGHTIITDYAEAARLWRVIWLRAREPELMVFVDDRKEKVVDVVFGANRPTAEEIAPVGLPQIAKSAPLKAKTGAYVTITGDNLLTLSGQTVLLVDQQPVPLVRHSMNSIMFKVPAWCTNGDLEVLTPLGTSGVQGTGIFIPLPSIKSFHPQRGQYDPKIRKGTRLTISGTNLRPGCNLRFATGETGKKVKVLSPGLMEVEVPEKAASGPVTLIMEDYEESVPLLFIMQPTISEFFPRYSKTGEIIHVIGSRLGQIDELVIGNVTIPAEQFLFHGSTKISFAMPVGAFDAHIILREEQNGEWLEIKSREIIRIVPRITGFQHRVAVRGEFLTILGEGLDPDPKMMMALFEGATGTSHSTAIAVSSDRKSMTVAIPEDAVSGFVRLVRKNVYSGKDLSQSTSLSRNKVTILRKGGIPSDLIFAERFSGELEANEWMAAAGKWEIDQGTLTSEGTGLLNYSLKSSASEIYLCADVLNAGPFGFKLFSSAPGVLPLQIWINLNNQASGLSWSTEENGKETVLGSVLLPHFPGKDYFIQLKITGGTIAVFLDQEEIQTINWPHEIEQFGLLSASDLQRWDNVLLLKKDVLALPEPDFYTFAHVPEEVAFPLVAIDNFTPEKGGPGTKVTLNGTNFTEVVDFYFGDVKAQLESIEENEALVIVPEHAATNSIEAEVRGGIRISTDGRKFSLPPQITAVTPSRILVNDLVYVSGKNFPNQVGEIELKFDDQILDVLSVSETQMTVRAPEWAGTGLLAVSCNGFEARSPLMLQVNREQMVYDLIESADNANWFSLGGVVNFGLSESSRLGMAAYGQNEVLEDGNSYQTILKLQPPVPLFRALRGEFPELTLPAGRLILRLTLGMLQSAMPDSETIDMADGLHIEVSFVSEEVEEAELILLPRSRCAFDHFTENYVIDIGEIANKTGHLVISVFPGRNDILDQIGIVTASVIQLTS